MTKFIDYVLYIDTFEQHCVVIKGMLQSPRLKDHMKTIGNDQSLIKTLYLNTNVFKTSRNHKNMPLIMTTSNN